MPSPSRSTRALVVVRTAPREVPEASVLVETSADQGEFEFIDEQEEDAEMAEVAEKGLCVLGRLCVLGVPESRIAGSVSSTSSIRKPGRTSKSETSTLPLVAF